MKVLKIPIIAFCLMIYTFAVSAQGLSYSHNLAGWVNAGYSNIMNHSDHTAGLGFAGAAAGVGYEYHFLDNWIVQTGIDFSHLSSNMSLKAFDAEWGMMDTEGQNFEGLYYFDKNIERQNFGNLTLPAFFGYQAENNFYFLAGAKVMLNLYGYGKTSTQVTSMARYDNIYAIDREGLFADMPDHGLTTVTRSTNSPLVFSTNFAASLEVGLRLRYHHKPLASETFAQKYYRLALFCDYGFTSLRSNGYPQNLIVNTARETGYFPALNSLIYTAERKSNLVNTLFVGLKFTMLLEFKGAYPCKCEKGF